MANYGKYYIAVRLLLLKQYLEANAGRDRIVKRGELEALLWEHMICPWRKRRSTPTLRPWGIFAAYSWTMTLTRRGIGF